MYNLRKLQMNKDQEELSKTRRLGVYNLTWLALLCLQQCV